MKEQQIFFFDFSFFPLSYCFLSFFFVSFFIRFLEAIKEPIIHGHLEWKNYYLPEINKFISYGD